jgi:hypothetical protein
MPPSILKADDPPRSRARAIELINLDLINLDLINLDQSP